VAARVYFLDVCAYLGVDPLSEADWLDDVLLVTTELVTNALTHTAGEIALHWWVDAPMLKFAVTDSTFVSLTWTHDEDVPPGQDESGRGLTIAAALADYLDYGPIHSTPTGGKWVAAGFVLPAAPEAADKRLRAAGYRPTWDLDRHPTRPSGAPTTGTSSKPPSAPCSEISMRPTVGQSDCARARSQPAGMAPLGATPPCLGLGSRHRNAMTTHELDEYHAHFARSYINNSTFTDR
jgi:hypothetical protein